MQVVNYLKLMRFHRPIGIWLLLFPTSYALILTHADLRTWIIFVCGVIVMRAAGCVINDYADRDLDVQVQRTNSRPLAQGLISPKQALILFFSLILCALLLALQLKFFTIKLAIAAACLAVVYPYMKRIFNYPQLILGIAFASSILLVYAETMGKIPEQAWILYMATVAWVVAYDTQYALADREDDLRVGIKSSAIAFGKHVGKAIFLLQCCTLLLFLVIGANPVCLIMLLGLSIIQQKLIQTRDPQKCLQVFEANAIFGITLTLSLL